MSNNSKVISTVVKLDGIEAVKKSFEALGKAGATAFKAIRDAADKVSPGLGSKLDGAIAKVKAGLKQLQDNARNVGAQFGKLRVATTRLGGEFLGMAARIGVIGGAVLGAGAAIVAFTKNAADNADAVGKSAEALGLSVKSYQSLEFAANQANISTEDFGTGMAKLSKLIGDGLGGDKKAIQKLKDLGIAYKDASGKLVLPKTNQEAFLRFADTIAKIPDPAKRAAVAGELLGKSYAKWIPLLSSGRAGIKELQDQFNKSGLGFTGDEAKKADAFGDALDFLGKTIGRLRDKSFLTFAEPLTKAFETASNYIIAHADDILKKVQEIANYIGPVFLDIVNAIFGDDADVKNSWILQLRDGVIQFGRDAYDAVFGVVIPAFKAIIEVADTVAGYINSMFGTDISGKALLIGAAMFSVSGAFGALAAALGVVSAAFGVLSALVGPLVVGLAAALGLPAIVVAGILAAIAGAAVLIYAYWDDIVAYASQAWELIKAGAELAWQGITAAVALGIDGVNALWSKATDFFRDLWKTATDYVKSGINSVKDAIGGVITRVTEAIAKVKALFSAENNQGSKASYLNKAGGGYISGPGTGTSDSIPARLSNGEFVIRAASVRKYGARLFAALNGMRIAPSAVGRFAMGGLVGLPAVSMTALPAAAAGPSSSLTLVLDGQSFEVSTSTDTLRSLEQAVKTRRIRATGRPNRYDR